MDETPRVDQDSPTTPPDVAAEPSERVSKVNPTAIMDSTPSAKSVADVEKYEIGDPLAKGGMGAVLEARDLRIRRHVAMKVLHEQHEDSESTCSRFIEEAQITGQLEHPNIVPIYELGVDDTGHLFYTMKCVRGKTIQEILDGIRNNDPDIVERYPLMRLMGIFQRVCDALSFAHSRGVIHRDLKPHNVMVGDYGEVQVMDWGLAKVVGDGAPVDEEPDWDIADAAQALQATGVGADTTPIESIRDSDSASGVFTMVGQILGTPAFMAPEQAYGKSDLDQRADIYALGGILYTILALRPPLKADNIPEMLLKKAGGEIEDPRVVPTDADEPICLRHCPNEQIPAPLAAVCMKALALKPEVRYQQVADLQADIEAFQGGFATGAEDAGMLRLLALLIRRHKSEFAILLAGVVLIAAIVGGFMLELIEKEQVATEAKDTAIAAWEESLQARRTADAAEEQTAAANRALKQSSQQTAEQFTAQAMDLIDSGRYREALQRGKDAVLVREDAADGWYAQGMVHQARHRHDDAIRLFREALARDPKHKGALFGLEGSELTVANLAKSAEKADSDFMELEVIHASAQEGELENDGPTLQSKKDLAKRATWRSMITYADVLFEMGRYQEADRFYERILTLIPQTFTSATRVDALHCQSQRHLAQVRRVCADWFATRDALGGDEKAQAMFKMIAKVNNSNAKFDVSKEGWTYKLDRGRIRSMSIYGKRYGHYIEPLRGVELEELRLRDWRFLRDLTPLRGMPLKTLWIENVESIDDLSALSGLPLESLTLGPCNVTDLGPLRNLPLQRLSVAAPVSDLSPLQDIPLVELAIHSDDLEDLRQITTIRSLRKLTIESEAITDITPLSQLFRLKELNLFCPNLTNLAGVDSLPLTRLSVRSCTSLTDLSSLASTPLRVLDLQRCYSITDLSPLATVPLEELTFIRHWRNIVDASGVERVPDPNVKDAVASVYLRDNKLTDAERMYRSIARNWPLYEKVPLGLQTLAQEYLADGQLEQSASLIRVALQLKQDGFNPLPFFLLEARIALEEGAFEQATTVLQKILALQQEREKSSPEAVAAAYLLEEVTHAGGEEFIPTDVHMIGSSVDIDDLDNEMVAVTKLGETAIEIRPLEPNIGARSAFNRAVRLLPFAPPNAGHFYIACRHLLAGEQKEAERRLQQCMRLGPRNSYGQQAARMLGLSNRSAQ